MSTSVIGGNVLFIITTHKSKISVGFLLNPPPTFILCLPPSWFDCHTESTIQNWQMFLIVVSQAPPVGSYEIKTHRNGTAPGFGKGKRFAELKGWSGS